MSSNGTTVPLDASGQPITSEYGYVPTRSVCILFVILFTVTTLTHFGQALRYRKWWLLSTAVLAGVGELIGWAGRYWSSYSPLNPNPYLMQIVCLIIAPTPLVGAIFISFGQLSTRVGEQYSRLSSRRYSRIFLTVDIVSLFIQSVGGGLAASSHKSSTESLGSNIMLTGIIFQLISLSVFSMLMIDYFFHYSRRTTVRAGSGYYTSTPRMSREMRLLAIGICIEALLLIVRGVYRTIELADGFQGKIIETEVYFNLFDGPMVAGAMYALNALHPVRLMVKHDRDAGREPLALRTKTYGDSASELQV